MLAKKAPKQPPKRTKTVDQTILLKRPRKGAKLKEEVWQAEDGHVVKYSLAYINPRICGPDNGRVLGYDNSHRYHHRHFKGKIEPFEFDSYEALASRFQEEVREPGEKKMKAKKVVSKKMETEYVKLGTGGVDAFFERSRARARKLDRGETIPNEIRITFEDPSDLMRVLSVQRVRLLQTIRMKPAPISGLAAILKRDRKAVSRDVKVLETFGLVKTHNALNSGHGRMKVVKPLAAKYQLVATI